MRKYSINDINDKFLRDMMRDCTKARDQHRKPTKEADAFTRAMANPESVIINMKKTPAECFEAVSVEVSR